MNNNNNKSLYTLSNLIKVYEDLCMFDDDYCEPLFKAKTFAEKYNINTENPIITNNIDFINLLNFLDVMMVDELLEIVYNYMFTNPPLDLSQVPLRFVKEIELMNSYTDKTKSINDLIIEFVNIRSRNGIIYCYKHGKDIDTVELLRALYYSPDKNMNELGDKILTADVQGYNDISFN